MERPETEEFTATIAYILEQKATKRTKTTLSSLSSLSSVQKFLTHFFRLLDLELFDQAIERGAVHAEEFGGGLFAPVGAVEHA